MNRHAILGPLEKIFALGFGRSLRRTHNTFAGRLGGLRIIVLKQNWRAYVSGRAPFVSNYGLSSKVSSLAALDGVIKTQSISCFSLFGAVFVLT